MIDSPTNKAADSSKAADPSTAERPRQVKRIDRWPSLVGLSKAAFYRSVRFSFRLASVFIYDLRCIHRENTLVDGGALILCTHQSHFDPILIGVTFNERLNYLARRTLFNNRLFGFLISMLDAIELDRDRSGLAGLKETLKRLKQGQKVLIFPEGTRTSDGKIAPLKPGFLSVARRSKLPLIPVAITGAYDALPRTNRFPKRYPLRVAVGKSIAFSEFSELTDEQLIALVTNRLNDCYDLAEASRT